MLPTVSIFNKTELQNHRQFYQQICMHSTLNLSYLYFCKTFYKQLYLNDNIINTLNAYPIYNKLMNLEKISINSRYPIAQFIVDIYFHCAAKYNLTINEFMDKSYLFSSIPKHSKVWQDVRSHLSQYLKHVNIPIHHQHAYEQDVDDNDSDDDDEYEHEQQLNEFEILGLKHNMHRIIKYISDIYPKLRYRRYLQDLQPIIARQMDVIFVPQSIDTINEQYFENLGIHYCKLRPHEFLSVLIRRYDSKLSRQRKKSMRSVLLIMSKSIHNTETDQIYLFEPLHHNSIPHHFESGTELPWIINSKSDILPDIDLKPYNALNFSFHIHSRQTQRVYLSYYTPDGQSHGTRIFQDNLIEMVLPFCLNTAKWDKQIINDLQFKDDAFDTFFNEYFYEFTSKQALISSMNERENQQNQEIDRNDISLSQHMTDINEISQNENSTEVRTTNSIPRDIAPKKNGGVGHYQWVSNTMDDEDDNHIDNDDDNNDENENENEEVIEGQQDAIDPVQDIDEQESESEFDDGVIIDTTIKSGIVEDGDIETTGNTQETGWVYIENGETHQTNTTSVIVENINPPIPKYHTSFSKLKNLCSSILHK